ncbi:MAG TPA: GtrA family protein [Candidatus Saccharimonadales bacterium]|nr:GtrA family protein [Candidatus Saccharimonadales bacterium]
MEAAKQITRKMYEHSLVRYIAIGGSTFALDFCLLVALHGFLHVHVLVAASISYWTSIIFNFLANRFWTFDATETHIAKHALSYGILLGANYAFTIGFIAAATHFGMVYTVAKILSVVIQTSWTYVIYKKVIFR